MKRKLIFTLSFLLVIYFVFNFNLITIKASNTKDNKIYVESTEDLNLSNIKFKIYSANDIYQNNLSYESENLICEVSTNAKGIAQINKEVVVSKIIIDLESLPKGYGVLERMVTSDDDFVFNIFKIDDVECNFDRLGCFNIRTFSQGNEVYTNNYDVDIYGYSINEDEVLEYSVDVITDKMYSTIYSVDLSEYSLNDKQKYFENIGYYSENDAMITDSTEDDESAIAADHLESVFSNYSLVKSVSNYNIYCDTSNEDYLNKNNTMANHIAEYFREAENFYVNVLGYKMPLGTAQNGSNIYLTFFESTSGSISRGTTNYISGVTDENGNNGITTYYEIYVVDKSSYTQSDLNYILSVCIHEFFHGVQASYNIIETWLAESTSTFMTLYYMNVYKNIACRALELRYAELVNAYLNSKSHLQYVNGYGADDSTYGSMIFFVYLYEKFGNIDFMINIVLPNYNPSNRYAIVNLLASSLNMPSTDLYQEFQLYANFASYKITKISKRYTSLWQKDTDVISTSNMLLKDNTSNLYRLEADTDLSKIVTTMVSTSSNDNIYFYLIRKLDNGISVTNIEYEDGFSVKYDGLTLYADEIYVLAINARSSLYNAVFLNFASSTSEIISTIGIGYNHGRTYNLSNFLIDNSEVIVLHATKWGYYEFEILNLLNTTNSLLEVYGTDFEMLSKVDYDTTNISKSYGTSTKLVSYVYASIDLNGEYSKQCYLRINRSNISDISSVQLKVSDSYNYYDIATDNFNEAGTNKLNYVKEYDKIIGDGMYHIKNNIIGDFKINISTSNISDATTIYVIKKNLYTINYTNKFVLTADNTTQNINLRCYGNTDITIIYTNCNNIPLTIDCTVTYENEFSVVLDKNGVADSLVGSEVRLNNGLREANTIMVGLTRCAFLGNDVSDQSRLNYRWYSSNESIASISQYGTITAYKTGKVLIQVYSTSLNKYAAFYVIVYANTSTEKVQITLTTDSRPSGAVGTEVSSQAGEIGGTTIHMGYTRLISLTSDAPSSIIQDYYWTTSDGNIARVSEFGTVTGLSKGTVVISCVYKYNSRFIGSIELEIV